MGNMELSKDNVDNIIKAYSIITNKYDNIFLYLYGTPSKENKNTIIELINKLSLEKKVILKGYAKRNEVPEILMNAFILVSSQPNTKRAEGGFPTKLGEYLAAGKPTLITDVGEISKFVTHNQNIFLAKPDNYLDYSEKIEFIINNYNYANEIALKGQQFLFQNYSHKAIGTQLANFIINTSNIYYNKKCN
jgi:glycosyltransferase involved in cell wall biosynthesis